MNKGRPWIHAGAICILLCVFLLFPLPYPTSQSESLADPTGYVAVTQQRPLLEVELSPSRNVRGILFWTANESTMSGTTPVLLQIRNKATGEVLVSFEKKISRIFDPHEKTLLFLFPVIRDTQSTQLIASLSIPNAPTNELLAVRGTLRNPEDKTSAKVGVQVIEQRSVISLLYEKLYKGKTDGEDIYYYWARGGQIALGDNPYICSLDDTCINHKNPGHFPLFYLLSAVAVKLGLTEFTAWIAFWRPIFLFCYVSIGGLLFWTLAQKKHYALAVFALFFWLFNRWSLYVIRVGHVDFFALLFLTLSLVSFEKRRMWSMVFFGISLSLKQVAIFLAPLYLILVWVYAEKEKRFRVMVTHAGIMMLVPLLSLAPFIVDNPGAVAKGLLFSATRNSEANMGATPLVSILKIKGSTGVIPMASLMVLIYGAAYRKKLPLAQGGLAIMLTFLAFNTVVFNQYFLWFIPFLPLALGESKQELK